MRSSTNPRRWSTLVAGVAAVGVALVPAVAAGAPAGDLDAPWAFDGPGQVYCGTYHGSLGPAAPGTHSCDVAAFMVGGEVDGAPTVVYSTRADRPAGDPTAVTSTVDFPAEGSDFGLNDEAARRVLVNYFPNENRGLAEPYQLGGDQDQKAAAVQAALWALGGDYEMDLDREPGDSDETDFVTFANYLHIMAAVDDGVLPDGEEDLFVTVTPPPDGELTSNRAGPFVISTNASTVTLDPPDDASVVDATGAALPDRVFDDGESFYLEFPGLGDYDYSVTARGIQDAVVHAWATEDQAGDPLMPLAAGEATTMTLTQPMTFTVYLVEAGPATPVSTSPSFTG